MACEQYGHVDRVSILQFLGGATGYHIQSVLQDKGIHQITIDTRRPSRTCTTVLCKSSGQMTELIEPSSRVPLESRDYLENLILNIVESNQHLECIALCGSLPPGITGSTYTHIANAKPDGVLLFLDACQELDVLKTGKVPLFSQNPSYPNSDISRLIF